MRYSRTIHGPMYLASTAVFFAELIKLIASCVMSYRTHKKDAYNLTFINWVTTLFGRGSQAWKLGVPAILYTVQNNLQYLAVTKLDAATFQVTYQLKILTTAMFSVLLLGRTLTRTQWTALVLLTLGVGMVQLPTNISNVEDGESHAYDRMLGLMAVLSACMLSGLAGVYFEKILKGPHKVTTETSGNNLWDRNVQLALFGSLLAFIGVFMKDGDMVQSEGLLMGYSVITWIVIFTQAIGGLIVALVVKYADNILKGFATSISIVISCVVSVWLFDFTVTLAFVLGSILVIMSNYLYDSQSKLAGMIPLLPTATSSSSAAAANSNSDNSDGMNLFRINK